MTMIRLPRVAAKMKAFAEVDTATHGRAMEIRQDARGAVIVAGDGRQLCQVVAPPPAGANVEHVPPFLVDAREFAKAAATVGCSRTVPIVTAAPGQPAAADRPLAVAKFEQITAGETKTFVAVAGPEGDPQTIPTTYGAMPDVQSIFDVIEGEAASGTTRAIARVNPRYLQSIADTAVAMELPTVEIVFAPRWNFMLAQGTSPDGCEVSMAIAGIGDIDLDAIPEPQHVTGPATVMSALTFTVAAPTRSKSTTRAKPASDTPLLFGEGELPF